MDKKTINTAIYFGIIGMLVGTLIGISLNNYSYSNTLVLTLIVGLVSSLLEFFLQFCFQPGNIFSWYREWLDKHVSENRFLFVKQLYNPLGGCAFCNNTWLTFGVFLITHYSAGLTWWMAIPCIVVSHLFLSTLAQIFWK